MPPDPDASDSLQMTTWGRELRTDRMCSGCIATYVLLTDSGEDGIGVEGLVRTKFDGEEL